MDSQQTITFEEICEAIPQIQMLHRIAQMIGRRRGKPFCANVIWYEFFRPQVSFYLGWTRRDHRVYAEKHPVNKKPFQILPIDALTLKARDLPEDYCQSLKLAHASRNPDDYRDQRLETSLAYEIAYQAIYDALPDCNHESNLSCLRL